MSATDDVIRKVKALLAKANGTDNEAEAMAFAAKAKELMDRHNIDEKSIDENTIGEMNARREAPWTQWVYSATAQYFNCKIYLQRGGKTEIVIVGREGERVTTQLMAEFFIKDIRRHSLEWAKANGRDGKARREFERGAALSLSGRLRKANPEIEPTALARIEEFWDSLDLQKGRAHKNLNLGSAGFAGMDAGDKININLQAGHDGNGNLKIGQTLKLAAA